MYTQVQNILSLNNASMAASLSLVVVVVVVVALVSSFSFVSWEREW